MPKPSEIREVQTVIFVEEIFDPVAARALHARLGEMAAVANVVLDFSRARAVDDSGLALLAGGATASDGPAIRFRGLSRHQERMLRYLGVNPSPRGTD